MMNFEYMEKIISLLKKYNLCSICVEDDNLKLKVEVYKNGSDDIKSIDKDISNKLQKISDNEEYIIRSPLVGTVSILENKVSCKKYAVGDKVEKGQPICTIEAMKMLNEVICNQDGIITEILIKDTQFVEYEQPLFKIRKKGEKNV